MKVSKINEWFEKLGRFQLKHRWSIPDRILHHSHVITIAGNSYRLKDCVALAE